ncbi:MULTISPECIES: Na+/H+ antiporter family protein [Pontibacillus]|uniref:Na+/H+ antiporter family protein n=1 Tax=Pontibacillus chungwhensis TaxID=265426 RepID=A0ABY8UY61_9BACI|nr:MULTISPECIES: Na+/H+ antiporter family protein [Pontibacillus]MCD5325482.1 Na+/H+ antiporter family protein [Pontibacillus sp. HN14]WIF98595.1 Na+/H+ antiporter family protein [Pontibacillus chungwhensis]
MLAWSVVVSVLVMTVLSLLRVNVIIAILAAGLTAGLMTGASLTETLDLIIKGMGGQAEVALSYILLGAFAVTIAYSGITGILVQNLLKVMKGKRSILLLVIAGVASLSQNLVPIHIAFIPILIPPLLKLFNEMKIDRRGVATALTFGLKAPYLMIPAGFGLIFHKTIQDSMKENGAAVSVPEIAQAMLVPGLGMIVGLLIAVFITYRKPRDPKEVIHVDSETAEVAATEEKAEPFGFNHALTILAILFALGIQWYTGSMVLGALVGLVSMFVFRVVPFKRGDQVVSEGIGMMGTIAFVMLIASGFANVIQKTGAVNALVEQTSGQLGDNKMVIAFLLLVVGLVITMGIGSSFGTIPILAALYVPICMAVGFSPLATAALIGTAGALGDAGSPASDSTLGPTSGLNADGRHNHIWDTCVPTFIHYNIPLFVFGWVAAIIL